MLFKVPRAIIVFSLVILLLVSFPAAGTEPVEPAPKARTVESGTSDLTIDDHTDERYFGWSRSHRGDLNGDGYDDAVFGTTMQKAFVYFGGANFDNISDMTIDDHAGPDKFAYILQIGGDLNNDTYNDLVISDEKKVYIYFGGPSFDKFSDLTIDKYHAALDATGDLNGDGAVDLVLGRRGFSGTKSGFLVYYGGNNFDNVLDLTIDDKGNEGTDGFGELFTCAGDLNGDSYNDLVASRRWQYDVYVYYGGPGFDGIADVWINERGYGLSTGGDLNNDNYDDLVLSDAIYLNILYGGPDFDEYIDRPIKYDGASFQYLSLSSEADINGDGFADLVASDTNNRKIYVLHGGPGFDEIPEVVITDHDNENIFGNAVDPIGDLNNDGADDLFAVMYLMNKTYLYFGRPANKITSSLKLVNSGGLDGKYCYARYKPYSFRATVNDTSGYQDLDEVTLQLDRPGANLQVKWSADTGQFIELNDPNDYISIHPSSSASHDAEESVTVNFNLIFNWTYPDENLHGVNVFVKGISGIESWLNVSSIYHVETNLEFAGALEVVSDIQGQLSDIDWISAGEELSWKGLKVVYENSDDVCPLDAEFDVAVSDMDDNTWYDTQSSGRDILIRTVTSGGTTEDYSYGIDITGIPPGCDISSELFSINIDADKVQFIDPLPKTDKWQRKSAPSVGITIFDNTNNVNASTIEFRASVNNGTTWSNWQNAGETEDSDSIFVSVTPSLLDGTGNAVQFRARDSVGNDYANSEINFVKVDSTAVQFSDPQPAPGTYPATATAAVGITITDAMSGVDTGKIEYSILKHGEVVYSNWKPVLNSNEEGSGVTITKTVNLGNGADNFIKWRAKDLAGNGWTESEPYRVSIAPDGSPNPLATLLFPNDKRVVTSETVDLIWMSNQPSTAGITYEVRVDTVNPPVNTVVDSFTVTEYEYSGLEAGSTYYWTVIPYLEGVIGTCTSGTWSFEVSTDFDRTYSLEISGPAKITLKQAETHTEKLTLTNLGSDVDLMTLTLDTGGLVGVTLAESISLNSNESKQLELKFDIASDAVVKNYQLKITAMSQGGSDEVLKITVAVGKDTGGIGGQSKSGEGATSIAYPIIAAVIALIIILLFMIIKKQGDGKKPEGQVDEPAAAEPPQQSITAEQQPQQPQPQLQQPVQQVPADTGQVGSPPQYPGANGGVM